MFHQGICVIGLGYIGLPTCAAFAARGIRVKGVDVDQSVVDSINAGRVHIVEPDLDGMVAEAVSDGLLTASVDVPEADAYLIAVPTPFKGDHEPDISYVHAAARAIAPALREGSVVILESTCPPGTTNAIRDILMMERPELSFPRDADSTDHNVYLAHCPERVLPGRVMIELVENDRIIGGVTPVCAEKASEIYAVFCKGELVITGATEAEMAKLSENSFRDVNIAFANELANVCERLKLDPWEVIRLANHHPRVNILKPGPGVGGHCIAVDPWFIVSAAPEETSLIRTARETNDARPDRVVAKVRNALADRTAGTVACLGLAFKANIDDLRESPAVEVTSKIATAFPRAKVLAVEPHVRELPKQLATVPNVTLADLGAIAVADVVVLLVDHDEFKQIPPPSGVPVIDTRGVWR